MFCKHQWKEISNSYDRSPMERLRLLEAANCPVKLLRGTRIIILTCTECGKLDKTVTRV